MKDHLYQAGLGSPSNSFSLKTNLMVVLEKKKVRGSPKSLGFILGTNIWTKVNVNTPNNCGLISVWTKGMDGGKIK